MLRQLSERKREGANVGGQGRRIVRRSCTGGRSAVECLLLEQSAAKPRLACYFGRTQRRFGPLAVCCGGSFTAARLAGSKYRFAARYFHQLSLNQRHYTGVLCVSGSSHLVALAHMHLFFPLHICFSLSALSWNQDSAAWRLGLGPVSQKQTTHMRLFASCRLPGRTESMLDRR